MGLARLIRAGVVALALLVPGAAPAQQGAWLEKVAAAADPAVGRVLAVPASRDGLSTGSGFVLGGGAQEGTLLFLTNHHVIRGADEVVVGFQQNDTVFPYAATASFEDPVLDLAVLELVPLGDVSGHRVKALPIRADLARKGESVVALGFPGSGDSLGITLEDAQFFTSTLTNGTVSKTMRASWRDGTPPAERFEIVQHTASINPGNSGGPLLDECANVVGLNTAVAADQGDGFQPNDTYWANGSPTIITFLRGKGIAFSGGAACGAGGPSVEAAPIERPAPSVSETAYALPTWAVAAISLVLAGGVIGGIVLIMTTRAKAAGRDLALPVGGSGTALILQFGGGGRQAVGRRALEQGVRIGRGPDADIRVEAAGVSRLHAMLRLEGRRLMLTDLGSTNLTRVDGKALVPNQPVRVTSRSRILLGSETLSLSQGSAGGSAREAGG
ncbi:trypsin-like peptidase domain-containing protein [Tabrizicola sp. M-4]|uniref:trypsin-like peptidase domain-containing protein n=1 Tax=Tabrizicola sp. M-4 TaxID=3055847 RepID=UPI003DA97C7F